ncbi:MAG TPA: hypothetical protein VF681_10870 [Abditibacteriaceae bacterium]
MALSPDVRPDGSFAPMPLRARGPMEILDTAVRVYKQYLWALLGWSAIVAIGGTLLSFLPGLSIATFLLTPLIVGACVCCIAAAVRGQPISFNGCWAFTKSRYGPMLGMYLLAGLVAFGFLIAFGILGGLLVWGIGSVASSDSASGLIAAVIVGAVGGIAALLFFSCLLIWSNVVLIVVCMEDDKRGSPALRRAYDLLRGHWLRVSGLVTLLGFGMMALFVVLCALAAMILGVGALKDMFNGTSPDDSVVWAVLGGFGTAWIAMWIAWNPIFYLTLTLFYLDLRIRKEALDLEWTAHVSTPESALHSAREIAHGMATGATAIGAAPAHQWANGPQGTVESGAGFVGVPTTPPTTPADAWYDALPQTTLGAPVPPTVAPPPLDIVPRVICQHCGASVSPVSNADGVSVCSNCGSALPVSS